MRWMLALSFVLAALASSAAIACGKDTECKGNRVCEQGQCVWPTPAAPAGEIARPETPSLAQVPPPAVPPAPPPPAKADRFVVNADRVLDRQTNLTWQRAVPTPTYGWQDARTYCAGLSLGEFSGWSLPTKEELETLLVKTSHPTIDTTMFPATPEEAFWTSSSANGTAHVVHFDNGTSDDQPVSLAFHVRCVLRPEVKKPVSLGFAVQNDTVLDQRTNLRWQREVSPPTNSWAAAKAYCTNLALGGLSSGWRLPTRDELHSLVERSSHPTIDAAAFPQTPGEWFWTASTATIDGKDVWWFVNFADGEYGSGTAGPTRVRCVR
jgi:hypothetical protein